MVLKGQGEVKGDLETWDYDGVEKVWGKTHRTVPKKICSVNGKETKKTLKNMYRVWWKYCITRWGCKVGQANF